MAKQTGLVKYSGTMGAVRHFKIKGLQGDFESMVDGPSGEQTNSAPEFERTRENMNEFGGCATAGKSIRVGLSAIVENRRRRICIFLIKIILRKPQSGKYVSR